jgi:hypothetical protein
MFVSHPSPSKSLLQSAQGWTHDPAQTPSAHVTPATFSSEQAFPQAPQWLGFVRVSVSQPSVSLSPLQSSNPGEQEPAQDPAAHAGVATLFVAHETPQPPQLDGSVVVSTHPRSQQDWPVAQGCPVEQSPTQVPSWQTLPSAQSAFVVHPGVVS